MDLADVSNLSKYNKDTKYLLFVIDDFSKHLWVEPVSDKTHQSILKALKSVFDKTKRRPKRIRSDKGGEFKNRWVKEYFKKMGVNYFTTKNETKANFAERVIRTIKVLMYRYFSQNETYEYYNLLQKFVDNYNNSPHRTLSGLSPNDINKDNEAKIWKTMFIDSLRNSKYSQNRKPKLHLYNIGDYVRISHLKYTFQRDYQQKWTEEVFKIKKKIRRQGVPLYELTDYDNDDIEGVFYENELQKIVKNVDDTFKIEKVISKRRRNKVNEVLVKWRGYPTKFNSWIKETELRAIQK